MRPMTPAHRTVPARHRARRAASARPWSPRDHDPWSPHHGHEPATAADARPTSVLRLMWMVSVVALGGMAGAVSIGGWRGGCGGVLVGAACAMVLARQPSAAERAQRLRFAAELPFAVDLVAAALRAGATPDTAVRLVAQAVGGPVGARLGVVERALRAGVPAGDAWAHLGDGEAAQRVIRAARRSGHSGAALAGSLTRVADDLRADAVAATEARARTAGVLVVLPLGLCFLPAFVLTGLVPVIVGVVDGVLTTLTPVTPP